MNRFAEFSRRHTATAAVIVFIEVLLYGRYAAIDAEFHFWLHGLFGASLGLISLSIWMLCKPKSKSISPFEAGFAGHIYSAVPDIIFMMFGVLHMYWMDVFALHISVHFIPSPVPTMLAVFLLSLMSYGLVSDGRRRAGIVLLLIAAVITAIALMTRTPVPTTLQAFKTYDHNHAWLCPIVESDL